MCSSDLVALACGILKANIHITAVDFSWNAITDSGFNEVLKLLRRNSGISSVSFAHNMLCDESIRDLHSSIHQLHHFTSLDLSYNAITTEVYPDIVRILLHNAQLKEVHLQGNRIPPAKLQVIEFLAGVNKNAADAMRSILTNELQVEGKVFYPPSARIRRSK